MEVYVLFKDLVYGCEANPVVEVYQTYEKARAEFDTYVARERKAAIEDDWIIEESKDCFTSYPDGYYVENHSCASITKVIAQ